MATRRDAIIAGAVIVIIILVLIPRINSAGGTTTITESGTTITSTFSSSSTSIRTSSTTFAGVCSNSVTSPVYSIILSGTSNPVHGAQYQYQITVEQPYPQSGTIPNFPVNVELITQGGGSIISNQGVLTGSQSFNYGVATFYVTFPAIGNYQWIFSWVQNGMNICQVGDIGAS